MAIKPDVWINARDVVDLWELDEKWAQEPIRNQNDHIIWSIVSLMDWAHHQELYLTVYQLHLMYGGPEEGGWWYTEHERIEYVQISPGNYSHLNAKDARGRIAAYTTWLRTQYPNQGDYRSTIPGREFIIELETDGDLSWRSKQPKPTYS